MISSGKAELLVLAKEGSDDGSTSVISGCSDGVFTTCARAPQHLPTTTPAVKPMTADNIRSNSTTMPNTAGRLRANMGAGRFASTRGSSLAAAARAKGPIGPLMLAPALPLALALPFFFLNLIIPPLHALHALFLPPRFPSP